MKRYTRFEESKNITVILDEDKIYTFSKDDIMPLINNFEKYIDSDNLSKWIYRCILQSKRPSAFGIKGSSNTAIKRGIKDLLIKIVQYKGKVIINAQENEPYKNNILWK